MTLGMIGLFLLGGLAALGAAATEAAAPAASPSLLRWRARDGAFAVWEHHDTITAYDGTIRLAAALRPGPQGIYFGEALSPEMHALAFQEAIVSWNIETPPGTWVDVLLRVRVGEAWSEWFTMGTWTSQTGGTVQRTSVAGQQDALARIAVDTLVLREGVAAANKVQVMIRLMSEQAAVTPIVRTMGVALSAHPPTAPALSAGNPALWNVALPVPPCSQMVYPDGGEIWCSPTSVAMVLGYWDQVAGNNAGPCEPRVRAAVQGVYDAAYRGHGNWPFNVAYAATHGLEGYVMRFRGLDEAEPWISKGVPVVISYGWGVGELDGAPISTSAGHLAVLIGFDALGNPILNDPAAPNDGTVRRVYRRDQLERLWLQHSGGTVYVIAPPQEFTQQHLFIPITR